MLNRYLMIAMCVIYVVTFLVQSSKPMRKLPPSIETLEQNRQAQEVDEIDEVSFAGEDDEAEK